MNGPIPCPMSRRSCTLAGTPAGRQVFDRQSRVARRVPGPAGDRRRRLRTDRRSSRRIAARCCAARRRWRGWAGAVAEKRRPRSQPRSLRARAGAALPGQHPGGRVRLHGCGHVLRPRLGATQDRRQGGCQLSVHPAGRPTRWCRAGCSGSMSATSKSASTSSWPSSPARDRTALDYTRGATLDFQKDIGAKYLELTITDDQRKLQPQFRIKDWE